MHWTTPRLCSGPLAGVCRASPCLHTTTALGKPAGTPAAPTGLHHEQPWARRHPPVGRIDDDHRPQGLWVVVAVHLDVAGQQVLHLHHVPKMRRGGRVCMYMHACVRACLCERACVRACKCVSVCVHPHNEWWAAPGQGRACVRACKYVSMCVHPHNEWWATPGQGHPPRLGRTCPSPTHFIFSPPTSMSVHSCSTWQPLSSEHAGSTPCMMRSYSCGWGRGPRVVLASH